MAGLRDFEPFLAFGGKVDPLAEIRNAGIVTSGSVFWVKATADSDYTTFQFQVGANIVLNDFQTANNKARNDKNDYVMVIPQDVNAVWSNTSNVGSALQLNKARMHFISVGYTKAMHGYSNTFRGVGTVASIDTAVVNVVNSGIEIAGFKFLGTSGTTANGTMLAVMNLGTAASGTAHETWVHDSVLEANNAAGGGANGTPSALIMGGTAANGCRFDNVRFVNAVSNSSIQLGNGNQRTEFVRCVQEVSAQATGDLMVAAGTGAKEYVLFKECEFINLNSAQAPASIVTGSTTTTNPVLFSYCTALNVTAMGTDPTVYIAPGAAGTAAVNVPNTGLFIRGSGPIV